MNSLKFEDENRTYVEAMAKIHGGPGIVHPPRKDDSEKPRFDLLPPNALFEVARVYTFGANKYSDHNWLNGTGLTYGRIFAAIMRHCFAFWSGENVDPETGLHHMAHAAFGCLALVEYSCVGKGQDDRPCKVVL